MIVQPEEIDEGVTKLDRVLVWLEETTSIR
jgi:hypothetical protein